MKDWSIGMIFLAFIGALFLFPLAILWQSYVLSTMWNWYMVPALKVAPIGMALSYGLMLVANLFKGVRISKNEDHFKTIFAIFVTPAFILFFGWIVHKFFM